MTLQNTILTAKALTVAVANPNGKGGAYTGAVSTTGKLKIDNRASQDRVGASNLSGGFDRPDGVRELNGYVYAYGDYAPMFPNDLFDLSFTMDGVSAVQVAGGTTGTGLRSKALEVIVKPYDKQKKNLVYFVSHFTGAGNDFSEAGSVPTDTTAFNELNVKSLGVKFAYWNASTHALVWSSVCYFSGMRLFVEAVADPVWPSCLNGIAYTPAGTIDAKIELGQFINAWPLPQSPNTAPPYMLTSQPVTSPFSGPGTVNGVGDLVYPDLDSVVGIQMATQVNSDLTFNAYWQLLYGMLDSKSGQFDHDDPEAMQVQYVFEKTSSPVSKNTDSGGPGWDVGAISYTSGVQPNGSGGTTITYWP